MRHRRRAAGNPPISKCSISNVWQEFGKFAEYRGNTAFLFVREGLDQLLAIGPQDFPLSTQAEPLPLASAFLKAREWLGL